MEIFHTNVCQAVILQHNIFMAPFSVEENGKRLVSIWTTPREDLPCQRENATESILSL